VDLSVRRARPDEASALSSLAIASKAHWQYTPAQLAAWKKGLVVSPEMVDALPAYVAEVGAVMAGFFVLVPDGARWKLEHFWVHPELMSRGVGRRMLASATAIAAQGGATSVLVESDPNAERFYMACGAERNGELAAPIAGAPNRVLPLLILSVSCPTKTFCP